MMCVCGVNVLVIVSVKLLWQRDVCLWCECLGYCQREAVVAT